MSGVDVTPAMLVDATGCARDRGELWAHVIDEAVHEFGIDTRRRLKHFLSATAHESSKYTRTRESMAYTPAQMVKMFRSRIPNLDVAAQFLDANGNTRQAALANHVYAGRNGNGAAATGDGWNFRGDGLMMITGRGNFLECERGTGIPCVTHPELLEARVGAARSSAWYFVTYCLDAADADDAEGVIAAINPGEPADRVLDRVALTERVGRVLA